MPLQMSVNQHVSHQLLMENLNLLDEIHQQLIRICRKIHFGDSDAQEGKEKASVFE